MVIVVVMVQVDILVQLLGLVQAVVVVVLVPVIFCGQKWCILVETKIEIRPFNGFIGS